MLTVFAAMLIASQSALGAVVEEDTEVQGTYTTFRVAPEAGAGVEWFGSSVSKVNNAGGEGLLLEGFGVGNFYVPNRRLNEKLEVVDSITDRPVLRYSYDCDGPNIRGLRVTRTMEPMPNEASIRVTWKVENKGDEDQWVAPWVRNEIRPGGTFEVRDRMELATWEGIINAQRSGYHVASRNWVAATDPAVKETLYAVFDADQTHSFLAERNEDAPFCAFQTAFVPRLMKAGDAFETVYRVNVVRGLTHVNFATDELAAQVDYENDTLSLLLAAVKPMPGLPDRSESACGQRQSLASAKKEVRHRSQYRSFGAATTGKRPATGPTNCWPGSRGTEMPSPSAKTPIPPTAVSTRSSPSAMGSPTISSRGPMRPSRSNADRAR